ncbi:hypothetical protein ANCCEY_08239 [Ancylostoma ceylanicum]|uniref:Uncharacterized protein n=1 Tax=Ancylostoma ceylanicum TaxID=53326 RepID=A0A0D6LRM1_9BILA|nr:hypothetical protein ANCCEY_08239 [Ancylostoma ceylanicum]
MPLLYTQFSFLSISGGWFSSDFDTIITLFLWFLSRSCCTDLLLLKTQFSLTNPAFLLFISERYSFHNDIDFAIGTGTGNAGFPDSRIWFYCFLEFTYYADRNLAGCNFEAKLLFPFPAARIFFSSRRCYALCVVFRIDLDPDESNGPVVYSEIRKKPSKESKESKENKEDATGEVAEPHDEIQTTSTDQAEMPPPPVPPKPRSASAMADPVVPELPERRGVLPAQVRPLVQRPPSPREAGRATPSIEPDLVGKDRYDKASKCFSYAPTKALNEAFERPRKGSVTKVERREEEIQNIDPNEVSNAYIPHSEPARMPVQPKWDDEVESAKQFLQGVSKCSKQFRGPQLLCSSECTTPASCEQWYRVLSGRNSPRLARCGPLVGVLGIDPREYIDIIRLSGRASALQGVACRRPITKANLMKCSFMAALLDELARIPARSQSVNAQPYYMRNDEAEERPVVVEQAQRATPTPTSTIGGGYRRRKRETKYGSYRTLNDDAYNSDMDDLCDPDFYLNYTQPQSTPMNKTTAPKPPERAVPVPEPRIHAGTRSVQLPRKKYQPVEAFTSVSFVPNGLLGELICGGSEIRWTTSLRPLRQRLRRRASTCATATPIGRATAGVSLRSRGRPSKTVPLLLLLVVRTEPYLAPQRGTTSSSPHKKTVE